MFSPLPSYNPLASLIPFKPFSIWKFEIHDADMLSSDARCIVEDSTNLVRSH